MQENYKGWVLYIDGTSGSHLLGKSEFQILQIKWYNLFLHISIIEYIWARCKWKLINASIKTKYLERRKLCLVILNRRANNNKGQVWSNVNNKDESGLVLAIHYVRCEKKMWFDCFLWKCTCMYICKTRLPFWFHLLWKMWITNMYT